MLGAGRLEEVTAAEGEVADEPRAAGVAPGRAGRLLAACGGREHGFAVVVSCALEEIGERAHAEVAARGFPIASPRADHERWLAGGLGRKRSPLALSPQDAHPSPLGHQLAADAIYRTLEQTGILARLEEQTR